MNNLFFLSLISVGLIFALLAHVSDDVHADYRIEEKNLRQISGIIEDKYDNGTSYYFVINGTAVSGISTRLYEAFSIGEEIAVTVDEKNVYRYSGVGLKFSQ